MRRILTIGLIAAFVCSFLPFEAKAGEIVVPPMPVPGTMVQLTSMYTPAYLQAITIHPDNALQFDFLINKGQGDLDDEQKQLEYTKLVKYFLASLTIADKDQWVNLSPYEKGRIIDGGFGNTEMGRDLLQQDYFLKQLTSSLMYPESGLGKEFWDRVYARAYKEYGNTNIPVNTFNKVWITPDEAVVYESGNTAYVLKSHLKVMLEEDYLSLQNNAVSGRFGMDDMQAKDITKVNTVTSKIVKEIILPEIEKEVNEGKNFALLRQIYSGMVLATWYKKALRESLLGKVYADKAKVIGIDQDPAANEAIYQKYLAAFKKGVYNYIKEDFDQYSQQTIPRKYFAGGFVRSETAMTVVRSSDLSSGNYRDAIDAAMANAAKDNFDDAQIAVNATSDLAMASRKPAAKKPLALEALRQELQRKFSGGPIVMFQSSSRGVGIHFPAGLGPNLDLIDQILAEKDKLAPSFEISQIEAGGSKGATITLSQLPNADLAMTNNLIPHSVFERLRNEKEQTNPERGSAAQRTFGEISLEFLTAVQRNLSPADILEFRNLKDMNAFQVTVKYADYPPSFSLSDLLSTFTQKYDTEKKFLLVYSAYRDKQIDMVVEITDKALLAPQKKDETRLGSVTEIRRRMAGHFEQALGPLAQSIPMVQYSSQQQGGAVVVNMTFQREMPTGGDILSSLTGRFFETGEVKTEQDFIERIHAKYRDAAVDISRQTLNGVEYQIIHFAVKVSVAVGANTNPQGGAGLSIDLVGDHFLINRGRSGQAAEAVFNEAKGDVNKAQEDLKNGGIDMNAANLNMLIKRDGKGVPLPLVQQDMAQLSRVPGFAPQIIEITPVRALPILSELQQKLQSQSSLASAT